MFITSDNKVVGFEELATGNSIQAIEFLRNCAKRSTGNQANAIYQYLMLYATYGYSALPLADVVRLYNQYSSTVDDRETLYLIKERIASRLRYERSVSKNMSTAIRNNYSFSIRDRLSEKAECPVFVITIPQHQNRFSRLSANAFQLGITSLESRGISGSEIDLTAKNIQFNASPGDLGCLASHIQVWHEIVDKNLNFALILEDDAVLTGRPPIDSLGKTLADIDIIFVNNRIVPSYHSISVFEITSESNFCLPIVNGCGTDGYIVTNQGARKLLEIFEVIIAPIDVQILSHLQGNYSNIEHWEQTRQQRQSRIRLNACRLFPFLVEHPPMNWSTSVQRFKRNFCPGLWAGEA